jgi:hypothetical protein
MDREASQVLEWFLLANITMIPRPSDNGSIYSRILSKEGVTGLLLFMFASFLMGIVYQGQQKAQITLDAINQAAARAAIEQIKQTEILQDIRYSLRENGGLVFRNNQ